MKKRTRTAADSVEIIAEIGTSHRGDLARAEDLIRAASEAGADVLKTQIVFADEIIHPATGEVMLPGGPARLYDSFRALEQSPDFYRRLMEITEACGMRFLASPFGETSLYILLELDPGEIKIASPELNHFPLLKAAAGTGKKLLLSTGVSTLADIDAALAVTGRVNTTLLHCITSYPAPEAEYNLRLIKTLSEVFGVGTGVSDHSLDPRLVPGTAAALGAVCIEKHFTLSKSDRGLDDPIALTPDEFTQMCAFIRDIEESGEPFGDIAAEFGKDRLEAVLGDGVKRLAPSERANYGRTNRSVHALTHLCPGDILTPDNTAILRTEKKLRPGLGPEFYEILLGRKIIRPVDAGEGIVWDDLF